MEWFGYIKSLFQPYLPPAAEDEIIIKDVTIKLEVGDITEAKADVLVNSTGKHLDLKKSKLAKSFLKKAGQKLQQDCSKLAPLRDGNVAETLGYELDCRQVYHCCCPQSFTFKGIEKIISKCMKMASKSGYTSIVIPSLGAGQLRYPPEDVVASIVASIGRVLSESKRTSLGKITLMVHDEDKASVKAFTDYFLQNHTTSEILDLRRKDSVRITQDPDEVQIEEPQPVVSAQSNVFPSHWESPETGYQIVEVLSDTEEWEKVEDDFRASMKKRVEVIKIARVQNPLIYRQYKVLRDHMVQRYDNIDEPFERNLWHGTSEYNIDKITRRFFDRSFAGDHGAMYGNGCYFSTTSGYSHDYSSRNQMGGSEIYMIRAQVLTGEYCQGSRELKSPPYKPWSDTEQYDSAVNDCDNPTIFVTFQDAAAYPEYVITYKTLHSNRRHY